MRRPLLAFLLVLLASPVQARVVTDSAGRKVEVPDRIERVFAAGPPASILLYMLAPEKMTGWPDPPRAEERPYIAPQYRDLPALGRLTGRGGTANLEVVVGVKPDLILDFGSVRDTYISLADNVQEQTKIAYVLIDGRFEATPASLRLLGDILGVKERGEQLAKYVGPHSPRSTGRSPQCPPRNALASISRADPTASRPASSAPSTPRSSSAPAGATWRRWRDSADWCARQWNK
jgi:hypothetical protein